MEAWIPGWAKVLAEVPVVVGHRPLFVPLPALLELARQQEILGEVVGNLGLGGIGITKGHLVGPGCSIDAPEQMGTDAEVEPGHG